MVVRLHHHTAVSASIVRVLSAHPQGQPANATVLDAIPHHVFELSSAPARHDRSNDDVRLLCVAMQPCRKDGIQDHERRKVLALAEMIETGGKLWRERSRPYASLETCAPLAVVDRSGVRRAAGRRSTAGSSRLDGFHEAPDPAWFSANRHSLHTERLTWAVEPLGTSPPASHRRANSFQKIRRDHPSATRRWNVTARTCTPCASLSRVTRNSGPCRKARWLASLRS